MSQKTPSQSKNLNDNHDNVTIMTTFTQLLFGKSLVSRKIGCFFRPFAPLFSLIIRIFVARR